MMMDLMNDVMSRWSRTIRVFILQLIVLGLGLYDTFSLFFWLFGRIGLFLLFSSGKLMLSSMWASSTYQIEHFSILTLLIDRTVFR